MNRPSPMVLAHAEWVQARAALEQVDIDELSREQPTDDDQLASDALDRVAASEWKIIQTPAQNMLDVRLRAMTLQQVFFDMEMAGEPTDNRHQLMLAALIHDVLDPKFQRCVGSDDGSAP